RAAVLAGWKPFGEVLWYKQQIYKRTAWGSWKQPSSPCFVYSWEHVQVFYNRSRRLEPNGHPADITGDEFKHWSDGFWHINPEGRKLGHPCPFPEKLVYRLVKFLCYPGMVVCDPWVGTGTTPAVARSLGRRWVGIDISSKYVRDARRRVAAVAGM
ncbi:MAG: site-specific DNA-methyltransferase, partial [Euryarchaeota archaeon]|nr:site-specific DNA-methyltransferase [Euryarchaeota archaeon]